MITLEVPIHNAVVRITTDSAIPEAPHAICIMPRNRDEGKMLDFWYLTSDEARDLVRALLLVAGKE